jgi:hypothetical protein
VKPFGRIEDRHGVDVAGYEPPPDEDVPLIEPDQARGQEASKPRYAVSGLGMALVAAGSVAAAIAAFLPYVEPTGLFSTVKENSLIQHGDWEMILFGVFAVGTAYRNYTGGRRGWAPIIWGLLILGFAIKIGVDKSERTLYSLNPNGEANLSEAGRVAAAGIGVYVAGAAGLITAYGGWQMRKAEVVTEALPEPRRQTKQCPDCAETILAQARVCKHCGYRFA